LWFSLKYEVDKFKEMGLTPKPACKVKAPIIDECLAHMECKVRQEIETGDKKLFTGEVIEVYTDESIVRESGAYSIQKAISQREYMP
jgi:flavin reductase (DIM6/NTAB) family NADH-FMN oxidoreductase RutF